MIDYKLLDESVDSNPFYYKNENGLFNNIKKQGNDKNCKHLRYEKTGSTSIITVVDHFKCLRCEKEIDIDYGY